MMRTSSKQTSSKSWVTEVCRDETGAVVSAELVVIVTLLVLGLITGLTALQGAIVDEFVDLSGAVTSLNQSYSFPGFRGCFWKGARYAGSSFVDVSGGVCQTTAGVVGPTDIVGGTVPVVPEVSVAPVTPIAPAPQAICPPEIYTPVIPCPQPMPQWAPAVECCPPSPLLAPPAPQSPPAPSGIHPPVRPYDDKFRPGPNSTNLQRAMPGPRFAPAT